MTAQAKIEAGSLHSAMAAAFAEIEGATKAAVNPHFGKKYADLGAVLSAIKPPLIAHGLFFTQRTQQSSDGVIVDTFLHHASGEEMALGSLYVPADKRDAQKFGSALSYARRYALMTAFGVPAEDDDGNAASKPAPVSEAPAKRAPPLDGPYTSKTALSAALKAFAGTLATMKDLDEFSAWMATEEVVELAKQAERDAPAWWETGDGCPPEFIPFAVQIDRKKRELEELDSIASSNAARNVRAG